MRWPWSRLVARLLAVEGSIARHDGALNELIPCSDCGVFMRAAGIAVTGMTPDGKRLAFCRWCGQKIKVRGLLDKRRA